MATATDMLGVHATPGSSTQATVLRLLIAGLRWPPETFLGRLVRGLADAGVEVTVACSQKPSTEWTSHPNFRWFPAPTWDGPLPLRVVRLVGMVLRAFVRDAGDLAILARRIRPEKGVTAQARNWYRLLPFAGRRFDVLYFPWNGSAIIYRPLLDFGCPVVISCRGSQINSSPHDPQQRWLKDGLGEAFERAAVVHCVSEAIKQEAKQYGLDPTKAWVIRPAIDPSFFYPSIKDSMSDGPVKLITAGSFVWQKGYEYALLAVRDLVDRRLPVTFDIIGDGAERQRILYAIYDLGLGNHVRLLGRLTPLEVREHLQGADIFLLASVSEGISNAVLEAMACGLPIVTTDCGGMREAVEDGVEGFVVPVREPQAMANALARLAADPALRGRMGLAARAKAVRDFPQDNQIGQWLALFQAAIRGSSRSGIV